MNNGTVMVVNVKSDLAVPGEIDTVRLDIVADRGKDRTRTLSLVASSPGSGQYVLPVAVALVPDGAPQVAFRITGVGLHGTQEVVHQTLSASFVPSQARQMDLVLRRECVATPSLCPEKAADVRPYGGPDDGGPGDAGPTDRGPDTGRDAGLDTMADAAGDAVADRVDATDTHVLTLPGTWKPSAGVSAQTTLTSVWARPNDVWAVGYAGSAGQIWHNDGTGWKMSDPPVGTGVLYGVWASGANDVWAVGTFGTTLHRTAAGTWLSVPSGFNDTLSGVWGGGPDDVWAVGNGGTILRWGPATGAWARVTSSTTTDLLSVSGSGSTERWAVGIGGVTLRTGATGLTWAATDSPSTNLLYGVASIAATDVWTVGAEGVFHYDGAKWSGGRAAGIASPLAIWASGANDVWAAGSGGALVHFEGNSSSLSAASGTGEDLLSVSGSAPNDVWAVGTKGTVLRYSY